MNTRTSILALAALAAVATTALAPTSASAHFGGGGHFGGGHFGGGHFGGGHWGGGHWGGNHWGFGWSRPYYRNNWYAGWHRPFYYGYGSNYYGGSSYAGAPVQPDAQPVANQNCLSKSYQQDGSVVFADNCTQEAAVSSPEGPPQGPPPGPRQPRY